MSYPSVSPDSRIVVRHGADGITLHCNRAAVADLRRWLEWMLTCPDGEVWELHLDWHFNSGRTTAKPHVRTVRDELASSRESSDAFSSDSQDEVTVQVLDDHLVSALFERGD